MNLEQELRTMFVSESERRAAPPVDLAGIMTRGKIRRGRRTTLRAGVAAAVVAVIGFGAFALVDGRNTSAPTTAPSANTSPSTPIQTTATCPPGPARGPSAPHPACWTWPSASPIDTTDWVVYESKQYGFSIKHPPGWEVTPAERDWTLEADAGRGQHRGEGAHEAFTSPAMDMGVRVWSAPAKDTPETLEGVAAWVERYCKKEGSSCSGLDRSVPLCNGTDCDPGLLVTIDSLYGATDGLRYVEAYFTGGKHKGRMIGVEVGRPEGDDVVAKYGGARRLLEAFLSGMGVCPARTDQAPAGCP